MYVIVGRVGCEKGVCLLTYLTNIWAYLLLHELHLTNWLANITTSVYWGIIH